MSLPTIIEREQRKKPQVVGVFYGLVFGKFDNGKGVCKKKLCIFVVPAMTEFGYTFE